MFRYQKFLATTLASLMIMNGSVVYKNSKAKATSNIPYFYEEIDYGDSVNGRNLVCYRIENEVQSLDSPKILMVFALHGFEDAYEHDGQLLVDMANKVLEYYKANYESLGTYELYVVACANPDGVYDGYTNNGYGRCNAQGIDMNRDFDYGWVRRSNSRNKTGSNALSATESAYLASLVNTIKPNIVIDFHGWLHTYLGSSNLYKEFNKVYKQSSSVSYGSGYFSSWAKSLDFVDDALLVEFPYPSGNKDEFTSKFSNVIVNVTNNIASKTQNELNYIKSKIPAIYINGNYQNFSRSAINVDGRTNIALREFCQALGWTVYYNNGTINISDGYNTIYLAEDSDIAYVNGYTCFLYNKVFNNNGSTFIPLRNICELLGYEVIWDNGMINIKTRQLQLTPNN